MLRPRSIAVVGVSDKPGAITTRIIDNLERFGFAGEIHFVSRSLKQHRGRACLTSIEDLPAGVDVALLGVPRDAMADAVRACVARGVGAAVAYASGFAETGAEGKALQAELAAAAKGLALLGPNCIGLTNYLDGAPLSFGHQRPRGVKAPALCVIGQSGGMVGATRLSAEARGLSVSYTISTGNEAVVRFTDFLDIVVEDAVTRVIGVIAEQIRDPQAFLRFARRAKAEGVALVLLHPGRSEKARESAASHTGAVASDHAVMEALVRGEGVAFVDTMEEMIDVAELLLHAPAPKRGELAIVTDSGAFKGMAADYCEAVGLKLATFSDATQAKIAARLPGFVDAGNPVDVTAQGMSDAAIYGDCAEAILADENVGALAIAVMPGTAEFGLKVARATLPKLKGAGKPIAYALFGEGSAVAPEVCGEMCAAGVAYSRSPTRALKALSHVVRVGREIARRELKAAPLEITRTGRLTEHQSKELLKAYFPMPDGALAMSADAAVAAARRIGFPVALKAQGAALPHKSDAGGVALGLGDEAGVRAAYEKMIAGVGVKLDGVLVEKMGARGLELIVSARRDPDWGVVLMAGLGGVWIEAFGDVVLMPGDLAEGEIEAKLRGLKAARLFDGLRGAPSADVSAIARTLAKLGDVMADNPRALEIEINPLAVYPQGALVLDALMQVAD